MISNWTNETRVPPCTINQAFQYFLDITTPPSPVLLQQFAALATNEKEKRKLEVLSKASPPARLPSDLSDFNQAAASPGQTREGSTVCVRGLATRNAG